MNETTFTIEGQTPQNNGGGALSIKDTTTATFQKDVIEESRRQPVLVDFWAPWCGPCKQLGPVLEKAVTKAKGAVKLVKMNIDEHPTIAGQMGIQSIPAVVAFAEGRPVDAFMGAVSESEVNAFIKKLSGTNQEQAVDEAIEAAQELLQAGSIVEAADIYARLLQSAPDNLKAIAGLAACMLESGEVEKAKSILATAPANKKNDEALKAVAARIALSEQIKTLGDPIMLQKRTAENPKDYQARFDLALILNAQGKRAEAADALIAIMKDDRQWNDGAAHKQLLQFFEAWGGNDPATLSARRKLSSLLFS